MLCEILTQLFSDLATARRDSGFSFSVTIPLFRFSYYTVGIPVSTIFLPKIHREFGMVP